MTTMTTTSARGSRARESCSIDRSIITISLVGMRDDESGGVGANVGVARTAATGLGGGARGRRRGRRRGRSDELADDDVSRRIAEGVGVRVGGGGGDGAGGSLATGVAARASESRREGLAERRARVFGVGDDDG